jgi:hypothetical protein
MRRLQVALLALVALGAAAASCGSPDDCAKSADIQVTVAAAGDVTVGAIARLHVMLSVADGPTRALDITPDHALTSSSAFILRPDPAPADKYDVSLTVQAFDGDNVLIAIGAESITAVTAGCNRMTVHLAAVPVDNTPPDDLSFPPGADLAGIAPPADLSGCIGGTPDEDADGRANFCDLCPADSDVSPVDSDGDGLPDACDPDPTMATNKLIYFEPFDAANAHWSGSNAVAQSFLTLDAGQSGIAISSNGTDTLPLNVRVQAYVFPYQYDPQANDIDTGIYVATNANPATPGTNGALCILNSISGKLEIWKVANGNLSLVQGMPLQGGVMGAKYRIRMTQRGSNWTCESVLGTSTVTVSATQTVTAPLFMALRSAGSSNHFHSVVAETVLP